MKIVDLSKKVENYEYKKNIYYRDEKQFTRVYDLSTNVLWQKQIKFSIKR